MIWYVYIAVLKDSRFYVGITHLNPLERGHRHRTGWGGVLTKRNPVDGITWIEKHPTALSARKREEQLKRWSHAKKQALIDGDLQRLKALSRSRQRR